ncbi:tRNA lysidine(34) synthetase TilS [Alteromonas sp. ASW11-19]|uniref:tRNA(Ile)-lysidine synthase n=1 Tax=Alteromonas salexigens TaxID=2982530 RepID=A0ABT2VNQ5_9ALTE|nr:tRNA lysidine(34) synthetase TilS [Alteromonas salexigens]MCU7554945.1 tRNA lysidine(34) synthetase TilS [Alteromonas salexigens]
MTHAVVNTVGASLAELLAEANINASQTLVVGFSGGIDSTVLLYAAHQFAQQTGYPLTACYVNHGLSPNAGQWQQHCLKLCQQLAIPFTPLTVQVATGKQVSTEAAAREARYAALTAFCRDHDGVLLLGQHQDDQLETVLLQLKRGAGPQGLSGMPACYVRGTTTILRPMLSVSRREVEQCASDLSLPYIHDESNFDEQYDRNFLRHRVLPLLTARWPALASTVSRSASLCAEQTALLEKEASQRLNAVMLDTHRLSVTKLSEFSAPWQRAIVRQWFMLHSHNMPSQRQLQEILDMLNAQQDAAPKVTLGNVSLRRFREALYWVPGEERVATLEEQTLPINQPVWLAALDLTITVTDNFAKPGNWTLQPVTLSYRITPAHTGHSKPLKQWFKQWGVPPWGRNPVAIVYREEQAMACVYPNNLLVLAGIPDEVVIKRV